MENRAAMTGLAARYGLERDLASGQQEAYASLQDLLAQIDGASMNQRMQLEMAQAAAGPQSLEQIDPLTYATLVANYDVQDENIKTAIEQASGGQAVDANSYIRWALATDPSMLYGNAE
jgi:hypothetical protein